MKRAGLALLGLLALGLQIAAIHAHSLSGDGAYHLLAGHQALRYGQNTVNFEHPPLVKLLVSLPLLLEDEALDEPVRIEDALTRANRVYGKADLVRRATVRGRYVALAVFVLPFLLACYLVGRRWGDHRTGLVLFLMTSLSLSVLPYLTLLQTDAAVSLAFLLTLLAASAFMEQPSWRRAAVLGLAAGFALAVKFSGVLLGPTVLLSVFLASPERCRARRDPSPGGLKLSESASFEGRRERDRAGRSRAGRVSWPRRLGQLAAIGAIAVVVVESTYLAANRRYDAEAGRETIRTYCANRGTLAVDERMAPWEGTLLAVERADPRLAQWLTGFAGVRIQNAIGIYPSYAFGEIRSRGRWWYFPVVLLIKTPLAILLAAAVALGRTRWRELPARWRESRRWILPAVTVAVYLAASVTSSYNLSVRHLLPVLPLLYLPVARFVARRRLAAVLVVGALAVESLALAPLWMSSTNTWWLGASNPTRFVLGAGNLEYRQNFVQLARAAAERELEPLYVLYPTLPDEVLVPYLPEARLRRPGRAIEPGWYAVNVTVEQLVPALLAARPEDVYNYDELHRAAESWQPYWQAVVEPGEDHGWVAGTFHLYRIPGEP